MTTTITVNLDNCNRPKPCMPTICRYNHKHQPLRFKSRLTVYCNILNNTLALASK